MQNARLDKSQARNKIAMRIINNLRNAVVTTLMAESKEELRTLLMKVGEESEKAGLKQHSKNQDHGSSCITSRQIQEEKVEQSQIFSSESLHIVTSVLKLEDACFLEGKL